MRAAASFRQLTFSEGVTNLGNAGLIREGQQVLSRGKALEGGNPKSVAGMK